MAKPALLIDLSTAIEGLSRVQPYSTRSEAVIFRGSIERLKDVEAVLMTIQAFRPGLLSTLEASALEELQVLHEEPLPEISALVDRYCKKREKLR